MLRVILAVMLFLSHIGYAQTAKASDPVAISAVQNALSSLVGKLPVADVSIDATVVSPSGLDSETGSGTFTAKGLNLSRTQITLSSATRTDTRNITNGIPAGQWSVNGQPASTYALHNCWTDAAWFFPAFSALAQWSNGNFVWSYVGSERHAGLNTQHLRVVQLYPQDAKSLLAVQRLSTTDFYLDPVSFLPLAVVSKVHPDQDMNTDIPVEIRFADYRSVQGVQVPFRVQKLLNGTLLLDLTVTSAVLNSGLQDSAFTLQ
jgi:hypothetical protein